MRGQTLFLIAVVLALVACGGKAKPRRTGMGTGVQYGMASWYGDPQKTASGERFNPNAMTAAHRTLPMHTRVKVTNRRNGKWVIVRINDRGPYAKGRIIDMSKASARKLGMIEAGVVPVIIEVMK